jgi:hypothetical protein
MRKVLLKALVATTALVATAVAASATVVYTDGISSPYTGAYRPTDTSFSVLFNAAAAGATALTFDLIGGLSLDGINFYEDDFTLKVNGVDALIASIDLGGGGAAPTAFLNTGGFGYYNYTTNFFEGGIMTIVGSINLNAGLNTLTFLYSSLSDPNHAGFQGVGDESWGVNNVNVAGASVVPLPAALPLFMAGLAGIGFSTRRRKSVK